LLLATCSGFGLAISGRQTGLEFASGYLIELSLSIDNLFVFLLMFDSFASPCCQRKLCSWAYWAPSSCAGVHFYRYRVAGNDSPGSSTFLAPCWWLPHCGSWGQEEIGSAPGPAKWITKWTATLVHQSQDTFFVAVVAIELVDLVFAIDSVPAVLAVSHHPFVVYTSNICAILGLRRCTSCWPACLSGCISSLWPGGHSGVSWAPRCCWRNGRGAGRYLPGDHRGNRAAATRIAVYTRTATPEDCDTMD